EGPLTPKDIDIYIKYVALSKDLIALAEKDPRYSVEGEWAQVIEDEWVKFAQDNNLTTIRLYYLLEKIQVNLGLTEPEQPSAGDAPYLKLSAAEKRLLADNKSRILAAFKDLWP
ncbi:MAG: hypothetical protein LBS60_11055, partial [Deltaproteobacteria bacterium]|nr:hypothetical protein [Deltaproteobacteria bacterium]